MTSAQTDPDHNHYSSKECAMYLAGDWLMVLTGPDAGRTMKVTSVRMFATDNGYYLAGGEGLYSPREVVLHHERDNGNPCGSRCSERDHGLIRTCDHCRGVCSCQLLHDR